MLIKNLFNVMKVLCLWTLLFVAFSAHAKIIYVNNGLSSGGNNGLSWSDAYRGPTALQHALSAAVSGDEVWVAAGTYKPSAPPPTFSATETRDATFFIKDGVRLIGGFAGTENTLQQRVLGAFPTVLSGDIDNNGLLDVGNAYHVVLYSALVSGYAGAEINGVTITGGYALGNFGTLFVTASNISKSQGGGVYAVNGRLSLSHVLITGNSAAQYGGGLSAFYTEIIGQKTIFEQNRADNDGGGIHAIRASAMLTDCTLTQNSAAYNGGGLALLHGTYTLSRTLTQNNTAGFQGGALFSTGNSMALANAIWVNNTSGMSGGAVYTAGDSIQVLNNVLASNTAQQWGGGIFANNGTVMTVWHTTFYNNNALNTGGGLATDAGTIAQLTNVIFWNNKKNSNTTVVGADYSRLGGNNLFTYCLLQLNSNQYSRTGTGSTDIGSQADGNVFVSNPWFVNPFDLDGADGVWRTADDGLALQTGSACINVGSPMPLITTDIRGAQRVNRADVGAYEFGATLPVTFLSIEAKHTEGGHLLTWTTLVEHQNKGFFIEKKDTDGPWTDIGFMPASMSQKYHFFTPYSGIEPVYYRLRQIDLDGHTSWSKMIAMLPMATQWTVFPNPSYDYIFINISKPVTYAIFNTQGYCIEQGTLSEKLPIGQLPTGHYWLRINGITRAFYKSDKIP